MLVKMTMDMFKTLISSFKCHTVMLLACIAGPWERGELGAVLDGLDDALAGLQSAGAAVGLGGCCSPRHGTHLEAASRDFTAPYDEANDICQAKSPPRNPPLIHIFEFSNPHLLR
jgi:hypothetical protein